jgi:hypothetical protein
MNEEKASHERCHKLLNLFDSPTQNHMLQLSLHPRTAATIVTIMLMHSGLWLGLI